MPRDAKNHREFKQIGVEFSLYPRSAGWYYSWFSSQDFTVLVYFFAKGTRQSRACENKKGCKQNTCTLSYFRLAFSYFKAERKNIKALKEFRL